MTADRMAKVAAAFAIAASVLLAAAWAFIVPIFQAPDEPAHFDDAMSILRAGRLVRVTDGPKVWIATNDVQYLLRATDFDRVAWHSTMKEPSDYGTPAYFKRLDAGAPPVNRPSQPPEQISYITTSYPYGFYALEAAWMWLIGKLTGSLVAMFFGARLLCVAMLGVGLVCNYYTALLLGMRRWPAAGFIAAIGLLPLTSFVSSYVQPDNLAYALLSLCVVSAVAFARGGIRPLPIIGLAFALGALAVTKYQFFIAAALPSCALLAAILWRTRAAAATLWCCGAIGASLAVFGSAQHWIGGAAKAADWVARANGSGLLATAAATPQRVVSAFTDCFISGLCAATYWQVFGWFDAPIVLGTWNSEMVVRAGISLISVLAACAILLVMLRNVRRLVRLALRGHPMIAAFIALADPALNLYVVFLAAMLVLYVVSNNAFTVEGRHFYPVAFVAMLGAVWYAPLAFGRRRRVAAAVMTSIAAAYSVIAAIFAFHDVSQRYYGPPASALAVAKSTTIKDSGVTGALWPVRYREYGLGHPSSTFDASQTRRLSVWGIAAFPKYGIAASNVSVMVDGRYNIVASTLMYDATVAEGSRSQGYGYSEFWTPLAGPFLEGAHMVRAYAHDPATGGAAPLAPNRPFFVTGSGARFSESFQRRLAATPRVGGRVSFEGACKGDWASEVLPTLPVTAVALFRATPHSKPSSNDIVWLDVEGTPYPTRKVGAGSYVGTFPLQWLGLGQHGVSAVISDASTGYSRTIRAGARFVVSAAENIWATHHAAGAADCYDPLLEMQTSPE